MNARIEALIQRVANARWLSPTHADVVVRVEASAKAFGDALATIDPGIAPPRVRVVRCAEELCMAFIASWVTKSERREAWRFQESLRRANAARWTESDDDLQQAQETLAAALATSLERSPALRTAAPVKDPPIVRFCRNELAWLIRDDDVPSPWSPLIDLWALGAWPVWLPGDDREGEGLARGAQGELWVYVPTIIDDAVAWVPDSPTPQEFPAIAGELMVPYRMEWPDWKFRQKDALVTLPRYRVAAAAEDLLVIFDAEWVHPYVFTLRDHEVLVGRTPDNTVPVLKGNVSKRHCAFLRSEGRWFVGDMGSAGGTFLNQRRVGQPELIEPGDRITFGGLTLRVLQPGEVAVVAGPLVGIQAG